MMVTERLKATGLNKLKPGFHPDGNGLYLVVGETGSRSWILRTMVCGKRRDIGLGSLLTTPIDKARELAADLRGKARRGEDIIEQRRAEKEVRPTIPTFEQAAITVHKNLSETFESETHAYNWLQSLWTYAFPVFGKKTVDQVNSADILAAIEPIWNEKADTAGRTLRRIKAIFDYCSAKGWRTVDVNGIEVKQPNPCEGVRSVLPKQNKKEEHHAALPYQQLPEFIEKLQKSADSAIAVKLALEFTILTCARTGETLGARWEEIDFEKALWTIPGARMKMGVEHIVPLSARAIEILEFMKKFNDEDVIFPGRYEGKPLSNMSMLMCLRRLGFPEKTVHGFRSAFKTWAHEKTKFDALVIEACMAHQVQGIEKHYLRTTFPELRKQLMNAWAQFVTAAPASAKVVQMRQS